MVWAWESIQKEARQSCLYLGQEFEGLFTTNTEEFGKDLTDNGIRKKMIEERDKMRGAVIDRALDLHHNRQARPVLMWPQLDKLSSAWLLALPGPESGLSTPAFMEAMCTHLCLPSPACKDRVGEKIGKTTVDIFGDKIQASALEGDGWRVKHDKMKLQLNRLFAWCRIPAVCEVFGLFAHLIPQEGLNRLKRGRKRQAIVPDFRLELSDLAGSSFVLAEVKVINCCPTRYDDTGRENRAVEKRAKLLPGEYRKKAVDVDCDYGGVPRGEVGPVQQKLQQFGELRDLVFGAFGESSQGVHDLIQIMAESRLTSLGLRTGRQGRKEELGLITAQIRRIISVNLARANAESLLSRTDQIGGQNRQANKRRKWALYEDGRMRDERVASWISKRRGINVLRRGFFKLN